MSDEGCETVLRTSARQHGRLVVRLLLWGCGFSAIQLAFKLLHEGPLSETLTEPYYATGSGLVLLAGLGAIGVSYERHAASRRAVSRRDDAAASVPGGPPRPPDGVADDDAPS